MALFPCHNGRHTYRGKAHAFYCGLLWPSEESNRWKLRLCGPHALEVYEHLSEFKVLIEDDTVSTNGSSNTCLSCGKPAGEVDSKLFITCYPANDQREDYWAQLHVDCMVPEWLAR